MKLLLNSLERREPAFSRQIGGYQAKLSIFEVKVDLIQSKFDAWASFRNPTDHLPDQGVRFRTKPRLPRRLKFFFVQEKFSMTELSQCTCSNK